MAKHGSFQTVALHPAAPDKPSLGDACNGCGVCCAAETCPIALLFFLQRHGPCPALFWHEEKKNYRCGLISDPARYLCWLPRGWNSAVTRFFSRRIAAGQGCDCGAEVLSPAASVPSDKKQS